MKKKLMIIGMLITSLTYGQEMGLEEILEELGKKNTEIRIQNLQVESAGIKVRENIKNIAPGVNLSASADLMESNRSGDGLVGPDTIAASVPLYTGGVLTAHYKKSKYEHMEEIEILKIVKGDVENKAIETYFEILNSQRQLEILKDTMEVLNRQKKRVDTLFSNGKMISKNEVLEIEASILSLENELLRAENSKNNAIQKMYMLLDINEEREITFTDKGLPKMEYAPDLKADVDYARSEGKYAKKADHILNNEKENVRIAKAGYLPKVNMTTSYKYANRDEDEKAWSLGVNASINIFQWGATGDAVRRAKIDVEKQKIENKQELDNLRLNIVQKYKEIELLQNEIKISQDRVEILRENSKIQNIRFTSGMLSSLDYLESINLLKKAEENLFTVTKRVYLAKKEYNNFVK